MSLQLPKHEGQLTKTDKNDSFKTDLWKGGQYQLLWNSDWFPNILKHVYGELQNPNPGLTVCYFPHLFSFLFKTDAVWLSAALIITTVQSSG